MTSYRGSKPLLHVDRQILLGKIFDVPERSFDDVLLAEVLVDGFRLRRRFHDYQSFCHMKTSELRRSGQPAPHAFMMPFTE